MGLVLVSHSGTLVDGLRDMVAQVAGDDVPVATAGGTEDGRLGTSAPRIAAALRFVLDAAPTASLVLLDLGSAALSLELALEDLDGRPTGSGSGSPRRRSSRAPSSPRSRPASARRIDEVAAAAEAAATMAKLPRRLTMSEIRLVVIDPAGLHARPAARFVQAATRFASRIVIRQDGREADAKSLIALLGLTIRPSSEIILAADGPDADAALAALPASSPRTSSQAG